MGAVGLRFPVAGHFRKVLAGKDQGVSRETVPQDETARALQRPSLKIAFGAAAHRGAGALEMGRLLEKRATPESRHRGRKKWVSWDWDWVNGDLDVG